MKFAFIGTGNMASALIKGMVAKSVCSPKDILIAGPDEGQVAGLASSVGVTVARDNADAAAQAETVLLCVKPFDATTALASLSGKMDGKLLISIVTGLELGKMEELAGKNCRNIRVMPNTPVMVGAAACAYSAGGNTTPGDIETVKVVFGSLGVIVEVREEQMDAVTALSGSGPAYIFLMIEALTSAGVEVGLDAELSQTLAIQTVLGAAQMARQTGENPARLREMVTSPKGTTAEALGVLESRKFREIMMEAVKAAARRAKELRTQ